MDKSLEKDKDETHGQFTLGDKSKFPKKTFLTRFRDLKKELSPKPKRAQRQTVVFLEGSDRKKNLAYYDKRVYQILKQRKLTNVTYKGRDATPKPLTKSDILDDEGTFTEDSENQIDFETLVEEVHGKKFSVMDKASYSLTPDLDDIIKHIMDEKDLHDITVNIKDERKKSFMKVELTETDNIDLYESVSLAIPEVAKEAIKADNDADKNRPRSEIEVQTNLPLMLSRSANTPSEKSEKGTFVSNSEMYDFYADLERKMTEINVDGVTTMQVTTYATEGSEDFEASLSKNENFKLSAMVMERLLAGTVYGERQKRFRNFTLPNAFDLNVKFLYRLDTLWSFKSEETLFKEVTGLSWCESNSDLLAVAYGIYNFRESKYRISGAVCVWNIKNPVNPERRYRYRIPVTAIAFSQVNPQLLAVALYDGTVEVLDITENIDGTAVVTKTAKKFGLEPSWQIQWIYAENIEYLLTASPDGRIMKFQIAKGPHLIGLQQLRLVRVEGAVEGLPIEHKKTFIEADNHAQALCLQKHPVKSDMFLVGSDEGCIHFCSINLLNQQIDVLQVHNGGVYSIDFSPFSPKIFLTASSDWKIRIWIENILEPIMEYSVGFDALRMACWSPLHPTIIASCTQNAVQIWDLSRKNPKPASIHTFNNKLLTVIKFTPCGRSLIVGDNEGNTHVCKLEDFPFVPHDQFDALQKFVTSARTNRPELERQIKQLGFLGYSTLNKNKPQNK